VQGRVLLNTLSLPGFLRKCNLLSWLFLVVRLPTGCWKHPRLSMCDRTNLNSPEASVCLATFFFVPSRISLQLSVACSAAAEGTTLPCAPRYLIFDESFQNSTQFPPLSSPKESTQQLLFVQKQHMCAKTVGARGDGALWRAVAFFSNKSD